MLVASIAGCTHGFEEINTDPNKMQVGDLQPYGMFEPLLYGMANQQTYYAYYWTDELAQFTVSSLTATDSARASTDRALTLRKRCTSRCLPSLRLPMNSMRNNLHLSVPLST